MDQSEEDHRKTSKKERELPLGRVYLESRYTKEGVSGEVLHHTHC